MYGEGPVPARRNAVLEFLHREEASVPEAGDRRVQLGKELVEQPDGRMPSLCLKGLPAHRLDLLHRQSRVLDRVVLGWTAHRRPRVPPRRYDQNGCGAASNPLPEQRPEFSDAGQAAERDLDNLESEGAIPEKELGRAVSDPDGKGVQVIEHGDDSGQGSARGRGLKRPT